MDNYRFNELKNTACFTCDHVLNSEKPILMYPMTKKVFITLSILFCLFTSCSPTKKLHDQTSGKTPDGLSIENAIIINEKSSFEGISAEWEWLKQNYPGFKFNGQSLIESNNTFYDKMDIVTRDGQSKSIYFNKSNYFRKD